MGFFRSRDNRAAVADVKHLADVCSGKSFQDLCSSGEENAITSLWDKNEQGPWDERFLQTNLATLAQLSSKKKLKLRGWGSLFEVGSSIGLLRSDDDSFELLAGYVLGVLYRASLQIFCPTDRMLVEHLCRKLANQQYGSVTSQHEIVKAKQNAQRLLQTYKGGVNVQEVLGSRKTVKVRKAAALKLTNLVVSARAGLEKLRGAYEGRDKANQRALIDACVAVARKVETQQPFKFVTIEAIVDRALVIHTIINQRSSLEWEGDMSEWPRIEAHNRALFRQEMNEGGMKGILRRVSQEYDKKHFRFADSESKQLAWAMSTKTRAENIAHAAEAEKAAGNSGLSGYRLRVARFEAAGQHQQQTPIKRFSSKKNKWEEIWYDPADETNFGPDAILKDRQKASLITTRGVLIDAADRGISVEQSVAEPEMEPFLKQVRDNAHQAALAFHQRLLQDDARGIALIYGDSEEEFEIVEAITDSLLGNNSDGEG